MSHIDMSRLVTAEQKAAKQAAEALEKERQEALAFLRETDYAVIRSIEPGGRPLDPQLIQQRQAARAKLG